MESITHWVDGRALPGTSGRTAPVFDPAAGTQAKESAIDLGFHPTG